MNYVTIDFEASCLPRHGRSFPIEVGIADADGTRSWLIKPHASWRDWDWTEEAFRLHGIERQQLDEDGIEPDIVMAELLQAIAGRRVIADSMIDATWWATLADAACRSAFFPPAPSPIVHVGSILDELGATSQDILLAQQQADLLCRARHRAAADARWLWILMSGLGQQQPAKDRTPAPSPYRPFIFSPVPLAWSAGATP
jgi:hypothetical protein